MTQPSTLIVSPHFDDAVLSLGGLIAARRRSGSAVTVLTIFSGGPIGELSPAAIEDATRYGGRDPLPIRRAEDDCAAQLLGFRAVRAETPELIFRTRDDGRPRCAALDDIFGPLEECDQAVIDDVETHITAAIEHTAATEVFGPLGIGNHVDHQIVRCAVDRLDGPLSLYQDMPYVLRGDRLQEPSDFERPSLGLREGDVAAWFEGIAAYGTQVPILFPDLDWRAQYCEWLSEDGTYFVRSA